MHKNIIPIGDQHGIHTPIGPARHFVSELDVESETWPVLVLLVVLWRADNNRIPDREMLSLDV